MLTLINNDYYRTDEEEDEEESKDLTADTASNLDVIYSLLSHPVTIFFNTSYFYTA